MDGSMIALELGFRWGFIPLLTLILVGGLLPGLRKSLETLFAYPLFRRITGIPLLLAGAAWLGSLAWPVLDQTLGYLILAEMVCGIPLIFHWLYTPHEPVEAHGQSR